MYLLSLETEQEGELIANYIKEAGKYLQHTMKIFFIKVILKLNWFYIQRTSKRFLLDVRKR